MNETLHSLSDGCSVRYSIKRQPPGHVVKTVMLRLSVDQPQSALIPTHSPPNFTHLKTSSLHHVDSCSDRSASLLSLSQEIELSTRFLSRSSRLSCLALALTRHSFESVSIDRRSTTPIFLTFSDMAKDALASASPLPTHTASSVEASQRPEMSAESAKAVKNGGGSVKAFDEAQHGTYFSYFILIVSRYKWENLDRSLLTWIRRPRGQDE